MPTEFFDKKENVPTFEHLEEVLQESYKVFKQLTDYISDSYGDLSPCWKFYSPKYGWTLKMLLKKRNLFFITPDKEKFYIAFVFGDNAVEVVNQSQISERIKNDLNNARKYAEGRGVRLEIMDQSQLEDLKALADIKINYRQVLSLLNS
jgi:hypothetical protein